jgi:hypothetical protein
VQCDLANGFRYAAVEVDRPGVPPGNEHAIRVNVAVVRRPGGASEREVLARRLLLPSLLRGQLPTRAQAHNGKARLNRLSIAEIEALFPRVLDSPSGGIPRVPGPLGPGRVRGSRPDHQRSSAGQEGDLHQPVGRT